MKCDANCQAMGTENMVRLIRTDLDKKTNRNHRHEPIRFMNIGLFVPKKECILQSFSNFPDKLHLHSAVFLFLQKNSILNFILYFDPWDRWI